MRIAKAEKTHIKLMLSASHEEVSKKRNIKGKAIKDKYREQAHIQKTTCTTGLAAGKTMSDPEERILFSCDGTAGCRDVVRSTSIGSLLRRC